MTQYLFQKPSAFIVLKGEDAEDFLQSQCSADLRGVDSKGVQTLWLNHKGRLLGDSWIWRICDESFGVLSWFTPAADLIGTIDSHIIADDVEFEDQTDSVVALFMSSEIPQGLPLKWQGPGIGNFSSAALMELADQAEAAVAVEEKQIQKAATVDLERARIEAGVLRIPQDAGLNFTPLDAGLEHWVSFNKGCFLGQEVVARMHRLDRHLWHPVRLRTEHAVGQLPELPLSLTADGTEVGQLTSLVECADGQLLGLAVVKRKANAPFLAGGLSFTPAKS